jgi:putative transposase
VNTQADLLSLNRSSLYYQPLPPSAEELWIKRRIDEIYTACPFYGSRKITVELNKERLINRKAVQRHMREMGLSAICPGPNLSKRRADHAIFPYLLRNLTTSGGSTLHTFAFARAGCIWSRCWIGTRATSSVGNSISH